MTRFLAATTIAVTAIVTLTAATQPQQPRFRYLGRAGNVGVVMATEATGPNTARRMQAVAAAPTPLPGGSDNVEVGIIIDCTRNTAAVAGLVTYLGTTEKVRLPDATTDPTPINPGSNNELLYAFACNGKAYSPAIWIDGAAKARAWALSEVVKK